MVHLCALWLAGVRHVALDQHGLRSFGQPDRPRVDIRCRHQALELPQENPHRAKSGKAPASSFTRTMLAPSPDGASTISADRAAPELRALPHLPELPIRLVAAGPPHCAECAAEVHPAQEAK
ncbi:hypothetical protein EASAB2608_05372 [Streptomyces sp. EAS-AB2608]|nr:hypothetical protein EASAB2608_05372 [Streptomyces sp. EAS-AB2608]